MIALHRLAHPDEPFFLNPDMIVSVEAHPDTVVVLSTGAKVVVDEAPEVIREAIRTWRSSVLAAAMQDVPRRSAGMVLVRGGAGEAPGAQP
jgi:uncharacterized protein YlzI (FlbEa/FlbD family)